MLITFYPECPASGSDKLPAVGLSKSGDDPEDQVSPTSFAHLLMPAAQANGQRSVGRVQGARTRRMFPTSGPVFTVRDAYESLREYEDVRQGRAQSGVALFASLAPLLRDPVSMELREIIVPMSA